MMRRRNRAAVSSVITVVAACSSLPPGITLDVNGWTVTCTATDHAVCHDVAETGIQYVFQARPTGTVSVTERSDCPFVAPGERPCWQVAIPIRSEVACIIVARDRYDPVAFDIVAAEAPLRTPIGDPVDCL